MKGGRDLALELVTVLACAGAASALFWIVSWTTMLTLLLSAVVVAVAGGIAWRSRHPFVVLAVGILAATGVAVSQGYLIDRMFADFCIFEPCPPPQTRTGSLVDALPLSVLPLALGLVAVFALASLRAPAAPKA